MKNIRLRNIFSFSVIVIVLGLLAGCETMDALMGAAGETSGQIEDRYGGSKYYGGSSVQKLSDAMRALSDLYFDIADFTYEFKSKLTNKYEREMLVRELVVDTLVRLAYDSLVNKNYALGRKIQSDFHELFIEKVKNKIRYYEYKVRAENVTSDFVDVINVMRSGQ